MSDFYINNMKDRLQLILAAALAAVLAWTFWHFLGQEAFSALPTVMLIVVIADNVRLRRRLRAITPAKNSDT